jgi:hypothetical protein
VCHPPVRGLAGSVKPFCLQRLWRPHYAECGISRTVGTAFVWVVSPPRPCSWRWSISQRLAGAWQPGQMQWVWPAVAARRADPVNRRARPRSMTTPAASAITRADLVEQAVGGGFGGVDVVAVLGAAHERVGVEPGRPVSDRSPTSILLVGLAADQWMLCTQPGRHMAEPSAVGCIPEHPHQRVSAALGIGPIQVLLGEPVAEPAAFGTEPGRGFGPVSLELGGDVAVEDLPELRTLPQPRRTRSGPRTGRRGSAPSGHPASCGYVRWPARGRPRRPGGPSGAPCAQTPWHPSSGRRARNSSSRWLSSPPPPEGWHPPGPARGPRRWTPHPPATPLVTFGSVA